MLEGHRPVIGDKPVISRKLEEQRIFGGTISRRRAIFGQGGVAVIGNLRSLLSESKGHTFESCRGAPV